jgi:hypothetical protein
MSADFFRTNRRGFLKAAGVSAAGLAMARTSGALAQAKPFIPYSNKSLDYYFFVIQEEAVKRAVQASKLANSRRSTRISTTRSQLEQWQSLMLNHPSAIMSDPIDSQAIVSAIRRYNQKKIPVGIIDTPADGRRGRHHGRASTTARRRDGSAGDHQSSHQEIRQRQGHRAQLLRRAAERCLAPAQGRHGRGVRQVPGHQISAARPKACSTRCWR